MTKDEAVEKIDAALAEIGNPGMASYYGVPICDFDADDLEKLCELYTYYLFMK